MGKMPNYFYGFGKTLPEPFTGVEARTSGVVSSLTPANVSVSTLSAPMLKAMLRWCKLRTDDNSGAIGFARDLVVVEYKSAIDDQYHLVQYNSHTGKMQTGVFDDSTHTIADYAIGQRIGTSKDGTALFLALFPELMQNKEFETQLSVFQEQYDLGIPDKNLFIYTGRILCDNIYRQIENGLVKLDPNVVSASRIGLQSIDNGVYAPDMVLRGQFKIFKTATTSGTASTSIPKISYSGKFEYGHKNSPEEQEMIDRQRMPDWYLWPEEVPFVCNHIVKTSNMPEPVRNVMFRGPAGTGKTKLSQAIADASNKVRVTITCNANWEIYDPLGQMLPNVAKGDANGVSLGDIWYAPEEVFKKLTGKEKPDATSDEAFALYVENVCGSNGNNFVYTETDFVRAMRNGWVVEIQEPTVILNPGVIVGLNSLLEPNGSISLVTGEVVHRHPDTVVVITTNVNYEGCREMNQSVIDRMNLVIDVELPPLHVVKERAMRVTGFTDMAMADKMIRVLDAMNKYAKENNMDNVVIGVRSLKDWMTSTIVTDDAYASAIVTIVNKASADSDFKQGLISGCLEPIIPKRR